MENNDKKKSGKVDGYRDDFKVKEEDYSYQEEVIIPYWEKRSTRHRIIENKIWS